MRDATPERNEAFGRLAQKVDDVADDIKDLATGQRRLEDQVRELRAAQLGMSEQHLAVAHQAKRADDGLSLMLDAEKDRIKQADWRRAQRDAEEQKWKRRGKWAALSLSLGGTIAGNSLPLNFIAVGERFAELLWRAIG